MKGFLMNRERLNIVDKFIGFWQEENVEHCGQVQWLSGKKKMSNIVYSTPEFFKLHRHTLLCSKHTRVQGRLDVCAAMNIAG
jgi:hypothetical protein